MLVKNNKNVTTFKMSTERIYLRFLKKNISIKKKYFLKYMLKIKIIVLD